MAQHRITSTWTATRLWRVAEEPAFVQKRARSLLWLALLGGAAVVSVALSALARSLTWLSDRVPFLGTGASSFGLHLVGVAVGVLVFAAAFRVLPARELGWREVLPGAVVAAIAFEILKSVGVLYLEAGSGGRNATFGTFAAAAGLLVACYLICQVTLLAAEINVVLAERRGTRHIESTPA